MEQLIKGDSQQTIPCPHWQPIVPTQEASSKANALKEKGGVAMLIDRGKEKETQLADGQMALLIKS